MLCLYGQGKKVQRVWVAALRGPDTIAAQLENNVLAVLDAQYPSVGVGCHFPKFAGTGSYTRSARQYSNGNGN